MSKKLTRVGHERLQTEYESLFCVKRPQVVKGIGDAAAEGDRSENAEYIYGKKHLREIDRRLAYLKTLLQDIQVIELEQVRVDQIVFGTSVRAEDELGQIQQFCLVGEGETDLYPGGISQNSPIAQALLGRKTGDLVEVNRPKGLLRLTITHIKRISQ